MDDRFQHRRSLGENYHSDYLFRYFELDVSEVGYMRHDLVDGGEWIRVVWDGSIHHPLKLDIGPQETGITVFLC